MSTGAFDDIAPTAALYWIVLLVALVVVQFVWPHSGHWLETHPVTLMVGIGAGAVASVWIPERLRRHKRDRRATSAGPPT